MRDGTERNSRRTASSIILDRQKQKGVTIPEEEERNGRTERRSTIILDDRIY